MQAATLKRIDCVMPHAIARLPSGFAFSSSWNNLLDYDKPLWLRSDEGI